MVQQVRSTPGRAHLAAELGLLALDQGLSGEALGAVSAAAEQAHGHARLQHVLGLLHRERNDMQPALIAIDRALAAAPHLVLLIHARARFTLEAGLPSLELFERAHARAPRDGDVILGLTAALLAERSSDAADTLLAETLRTHPGWIAGQTELARLRAQHGGRVLESIDTALRGAPRDTDLWQLRHAILHRARLFEQAQQSIGFARRQLGADAMIDAEAMTSTEQGAHEQAEAAFARINPLGDGSIAVHWMRHLLRRGEPARVSELHGQMPATVAREAWPYLSAAWRMLGDARARWLDGEELIKVVDFGADWPILEPLADTLRDFHYASNQPLDQSVRGGTQTDGLLLRKLEPAIQALRKRFAHEIEAYVAALPSRDAKHPLLGSVPRDPCVVGAWSVRLAAGGFHTEHVHTHGWLSSAFYVALPSFAPDKAADAGFLTLGQPQSEIGTGLGPLRSIEPKPGRLVLFPSTLWHGTRPFAAGERLTVAFDVA